MIHPFNAKGLLGLSLLGSGLSIAAYTSAASCPTCCNTDPDAYSCFLEPDPSNPRQSTCDMGKDIGDIHCQNFPGLTFSGSPDKVLEIDWNGQQPNGPLPTNAFSFGFTNSGAIACQLVAGGFQRNVPTSATTRPGECDAATKWVYDANSN